MLCNEAIKYQSSIQIVTGSTTANAKSVLSILGACVKCGDEIELICEGNDEEEAFAAVAGLIESGSGRIKEAIGAFAELCSVESH